MTASTALTEAARRWLADGMPAVEVLVLEARGSVPRQMGTRMLVAADAVVGTIGGGHLERQAIERARALLADCDDGPDDRHYPLGPALGQCCGGALTLRTQRLTQPRFNAWPAPAPRFTLQLYGAGHVGRAIVQLLERIDCQVQWIDEREAEFPAAPPGPHIERVCVEPVDAEVRRRAAGRFLPRADAQPRPRPADHRGDPAARRLRLLRADRLGDQACALRPPPGAPRHRLRGAGADDVPDRRRRDRRQEPDVIAIAAVAQLLQRAGA